MIKLQKDMDLLIRQETEEDHKAVFELIALAFAGQTYSDKSEHFLVERLRRSDCFIAELSLVAVLDGDIVGHILISSVKIVNELSSFDSLSLAPVSVLLVFQKRGIGSKLINTAHKIAKDLGHSTIVLLGHASYYPRFGYHKCSDFDITLPFDSSDDNCMIVELYKNALEGVSGEVIYPPVFFG